MAARKVNRPAGGSGTLKARGHKPVLFGVSPDEHQTLRQAAAACGLPMSHFAKDATLAAAEKIMEKIRRGG
jgi:uncharacterized protein (DUF1778 family)